MAVLDWLQQMLGGGDPEAQGAAAASTAMMPAVNQWAQNVGSGQYVQQGLPSAYDPNQSFAQNALNPNSLENALNVALGVGGGSGLGIKAYHGSPYDFSAFDASKIGTGEGAQAYGHGLYFAENPRTAQDYRRSLAPGPSEVIGPDGSVVTARGSIGSTQALSEAALAPIEGEDYIKRAIARAWLDKPEAPISAKDVSWNAFGNMALVDSPEAHGLVSKMLEQAQPLLDKYQMRQPGKMYEVDINAEPQQFLDWDKPLSEQPQQVKDALKPFYGEVTTRPIGNNPTLGELHDLLVNGQSVGAFPASELAGKDLTQIAMAHDPRTGGSIYESRRIVPGEYRDPVAASQTLQGAGIPGIRYLDQGSRVVPGQISINRKIINDPNVPQAMRDQAKADLAKWESENTTSNYVVFDPSIIQILRKYGLAGLTAGGGLLGAADQQ